MATNLLNLADFKVQKVEESDHDYHVYAEASNTPSACNHCSSRRLIGHGRNEQVIRDLPTHGKRLAIYVDTRRWRCQDCGKTFMETLPAVNAKREMTDRLVKWIGQQSLKRTFASIADDTGRGGPIRLNTELISISGTRSVKLPVESPAAMRSRTHPGSWRRARSADGGCCRTQ